MKKGAIELSMNFIVIIIISVVLFGFGIYFISRLSSQAIDLKDITSSELDEKISNLVCETSDRVCIGIDRKTIQRGKFDVFGVKILNILDTQDFDITVSPPSDVLGYKKDKSEITNPPNVPLIVNPQERSIKISKNDEQTLGFGIEVPKDAVSGTYIFNIEIKTQSGSAYVPILKFYVDVP
ncbi:MAG TPA: hypothetical protein VJI97_01045 [Candidatus Nanoarchaeia archaeon]|nr:hypothetical protein [Candidatus Nanoarchaeia archaeon]